MVFGNDPRGHRKRAAERLVDRLPDTDRVAIVDFDDRAAIRAPLTPLDSKTHRAEVRQAIEAVDSSGGTDLSLGLAASLEALGEEAPAGRSRAVIFLTDGVGAFDPSFVEAARRSGVVIHTVGLGSGVDARLLRDAIALPTGGTYHPVGRAADLSAAFETIYTQQIDMASRSVRVGPRDARLETSSIALFLFRVVSWGLMGLLIGTGQGVRENTREDLRACAFGGLIGGLAGGALFDPVSHLGALGAGFLGRALADAAVGASIGGSMRLAQRRLVETTGRPTTTLLRGLPRGSGLSPRKPERAHVRLITR